MSAPQIRIQSLSPNVRFAFSIDAAGGASESFRDGYTANVPFKDEGNLQGQLPHPAEVQYQYGQFDNTSFSLTLFSGIVCNGKSYNTGRDLGGLTEALYRLSLPVKKGSLYIGPPPLVLQYGQIWAARGFFSSIKPEFKGAWDIDNLPTLIELSFEFVRHFGRPTDTSYGRASTELVGATYDGFKLGGAR